VRKKHTQTQTISQRHALNDLSITYFLISVKLLIIKKIQMGSNCFLPPRENRQRYKELLEHSPKEEAQKRWIIGLPSGSHGTENSLQGPVGEEASDRHQPCQAST
jgi:hypothetical protein